MKFIIFFPVIVEKVLMSVIGEERFLENERTGLTWEFSENLLSFSYGWIFCLCMYVIFNICEFIFGKLRKKITKFVTTNLIKVYSKLEKHQIFWKSLCKKKLYLQNIYLFIYIFLIKFMNHKYFKKIKRTTNNRKEQKRTTTIITTWSGI